MEQQVREVTAIGTSVSTAELRDLAYPSPEFQAWVREAHDSGRLGIILQAVILTGLADSVTGAIGYLGQYMASQPLHSSRVTVADLEARAPRYHHFSKLARLVEGQAGRQQDPHLYYGLVGHQAIFDLFTGQLAIEPATTTEQLGLWDNPPAQIVDESGQSGFDLGLPSPEKDPFISSYRQRLEWVDRAWHRAVRESGSSSPLHPTLRAYTASRIQSMSRRLFRHHADKVLGDRRDPSRQWWLLSCLSWGAAVARARRERQPRIFFREIPVIDVRHEVGGGRIDALEVTQINGHRPTKKERRSLTVLAQERYASSGELFRRLRQNFRGPLEVTIIDWKFLVGDIIQSNRQTTVPDVTAGPLSDHLRQMQRYLLLVPFDDFLHTRQGHLWEASDIQTRGEIWYLLPTSPIIVHHVTMTTEERRAAFTENVALSWPATQRRAALRQMNNLVFGHLIDTLAGRKRNGNGHRHNGHKNDVLNLFPQDVAPSAHELIAAHRQDHPVFLDEHQTIEVIGQDAHGNRRYGLRFDRLLKAIHDGRVPPPRTFNKERGGHVVCLFPDHDDSTPSMHLSLDRHRFFCFGCERGGEILAESIPEGYGAELELDMSRLRNGSRAAKASTFNGWAPDEHVRVMSLAQELLRASVRSSSGAGYLTRVRGLDLDLAIEHGAGFGDDRLINGLLDLGVSLDELRYYGFLGFSDAITTRGGIVPLLRRRGFKDEHMVRPVAWSKRKGQSLGMPYSALQSRVTFPLELHGRLNNFYGRSVNPTAEPHMRHRKLSIEATGVAQGGFRLNLIAIEPPADVIVTEGALDALSLIALGHPAAISMIGVGNRAIVDALASFSGNLAIAFDFDDNAFRTGQTKTKKLEESLRQAGFAGQIHDFTSWFMAQHPGRVFKDYNQFLVDHVPSL